MKPLVLGILDGWGLAPPGPHNAISQTLTPTWDALWSMCPKTTLQASEHFVGLPKGQMGNSEVGHMTLGSGRYLPQDLGRISQALDEKTFPRTSPWHAFVKHLKQEKAPCHLMGLFSPGGVHSHQKHLITLLTCLLDAGVPVYFHAITDGRDTTPRGAVSFFEALTDIEKHPHFTFATLSGRYYAMDRDCRWKRTQKAVDALWAKGPRTTLSPKDYMQSAYDRGISDEFIEPVFFEAYEPPTDGHGFLWANFRADRGRQILEALLKPSFGAFEVPGVISTHAMTLTPVDTELAPYHKVLFEKSPLKDTLGEVLSKHAYTQLRLAETEKYAHVTYFMNGGRENPFQGEKRCLVPSPKVATYDLKPDMAALEVTKKVCDALENKEADVIIVNWANADMVGHTGHYDAACEAVAVLDRCLGLVCQAVEKAGGVFLLTADHGNVEVMRHEDTQKPHTSHTTNVVPCLLFENFQGEKTWHLTQASGTLQDVAPTVLDILGLEKPLVMTGKSLLQKSLVPNATNKSTG